MQLLCKIACYVARTRARGVEITFLEQDEIRVSSLQKPKDLIETASAIDIPTDNFQVVSPLRRYLLARKRARLYVLQGHTFATNLCFCAYVVTAWLRERTERADSVKHE